MNAASVTNPMADIKPRDLNRRMLRGLMYREWLMHGWWITLFLVVWFIGVWALELFTSWTSLLVLGMVYAFAAGPALGGSDVREGCEEFCFALPPTRRQRFVLRLALGGIPLALMMMVGVLAIGFDLPQAAWGLVVESGFTKPYPASFWTRGCLCVLLLPASMYLVGFCVAATAKSNGSVAGAPWLAMAVTGLPVAIAAVAKRRWILSVAGEQVPPYRDIRVATALLMVSVAAAVWTGYCASLYERKEGHTRQTDVEVGMPGWVRNGIALLVVVIVMLALTVGQFRVAR